MPVPSHPSNRDSAAATTSCTYVVRLRVAFSGRHIDAAHQIDRRLQAHLRGSGLVFSLSATHLTLAGALRVVTPGDWTSVIGWLLCQPEVVFVAREFPISRRSHGQHQ